MTRRAKNIALIALVALMINLPLVHSTAQDLRLDRSGVDVAAQVTETREVGDNNLVWFTVPAGGGLEESTGQARVSDAAYDLAVTTQQIEVRVLPENQAVYRAEGEVRSRVPLVVILVADLFLALIVLLMVRYGPRLRPVLVLVATEDLERCPPGSVLDRIEGDRYVVCGEVATIGDGEVTLDLGDRRVRVLLDGHDNPAGYQQPVRATGRMIA